MNPLTFIQAHQLQNVIYLVIFFAMFVDAALTVFAAAFLVSIGTAALFPSLVVLYCGIFCEQLFFYWLGRTLSRSDRLTLWANKLAAPFDHHLQKRTFRTLLVSKFVYGLHRAILIRSGMLKISLSIFTKYVLVVSVIWLGLVGGLAFVFSASYQGFKKYVSFAEVIFFILVIGYFIAQRLFARRLGKKL